jgi:hypothetical protein
MARRAFVALAIGLFACGGSSTATFDNSGQGGVIAGPDGGSSEGVGGASKSTGAGGSGNAAGGASGSVGMGGANTGGAGGAHGTGGSGGANVGGSNAGGASGTGGTGGGVVDAGAKEGGSPRDGGGGAECTVDSDCRWVDNCCECAALPANERPRACGMVCAENACAAPHVQGVRCSLGKCVLAQECDARDVLCRVAAPNCPAGQVPSVKGTCWGECVVASSCRTVASCEDCRSDSYVCARDEVVIGSTPIRCVDVPAACANDLSCGCVGPYACLTPFVACSSSMNGKTYNCSCPNC